VGDLPDQSTRERRLYLYQWRGDSDFDPGLLQQTGTAHGNYP